MVTSVSFYRRNANPKIPYDHKEGLSVGEWVQLATVPFLKNGTMKKVSAGGAEFLLAKVSERYYCTDAYCPHLGGDLSQGSLTGTVITCPLHHSQFSLVDGHVIRWTDLAGIVLTAAVNQKPPRPLRTYPVTIQGNAILVSKER